MPEKNKGWDETGTSYRYRIRAPDDFQEGTFRTIEMQNTDGIKMVVGKLKNGTGSMVAQSLIFPKDSGWTLEKAKKWVKDHTSVEKSTGELPMPLEPITKEQWTTEFINSLPDAAFAVIEPAYLRGEINDKRARHLPHHGKGVTDPNDDGMVDLPHLRNALARANQIQPITDSITAEELRKKAMAHLQAHAKRLGIGEVGEVKKEIAFKKADLQKRIVYGEVYVPNEKDSQGQWMTAEEIEKMAHRFMENLRLTQIDKQHDWEPDEGVVVDKPIPGELRNVDVQMVSLVSKGANRRQFKIFKSADLPAENKVPQPKPDDEQQYRGLFQVLKEFFTGTKKADATSVPSFAQAMAAIEAEDALWQAFSSAQRLSASLLLSGSAHPGSERPYHLVLNAFRRHCYYRSFCV